MALIFALNLFTAVISLYAFRSTLGSSVARGSLCTHTSNWLIRCPWHAPSGAKVPQQPALCLCPPHPGACWEIFMEDPPPQQPYLCPWSSMAVPFLPPMSHMMTEWSELPENSTRCTGSQQSAVTPPKGTDTPGLVTEQQPHHGRGSWCDQDPHSPWIKCLLNEWVSKLQKRKTAPKIKNSAWKQHIYCNTA